MDSATIGLIAGSSVAVFLVLAIIILACVARSVKRRQINLSNTFGYTIDPDMWPVEGVRIKRSRKARTIPRQVPGQDVRVNYREPPCSRRQSSGQGVYINPHSTHLDPRAYPDNRRQSSRQSVYINPHSDPWTTPDIRIHSQRQEAYRSIYSAHNNPRAFSGGRRHSAKQDVNLNPYSTYLDPRQTQSMWLQQEIQNLVSASHEAKTKSYSRYSKFRVGAALMCEDGTVIKGCNVENASYGLTICAERTAIVKAVSDGHRKFKAIAIASDLADSIITPCGACRQFLVEFGVDWDVYMSRPDMSYKMMKTGDLLPLCFAPDSLEEERISHSA